MSSAYLLDSGLGLAEFIVQQVVVFWKDWPIMEMVVAPLGGPNDDKFSLSGMCPHCNRPSVFMMVTTAHIENLPRTHAHVVGSMLWAGMQCQGCLSFIFAAVRKIVTYPNSTAAYYYVEHYPLGKPNDEVAPEIPENIAADFKEALRCRFIDAWNATVEMCRRAVQASCLQLGAPSDKRLVQQIDWLAEKGTITTPLKEMAHRVRLGGNLGAHPPDDPEDQGAIIIGPEYADAVIEFTRDYFQHVYVMPQRLQRFTFRKKIE